MQAQYIEHKNYLEKKGIKMKQKLCAVLLVVIMIATLATPAGAIASDFVIKGDVLVEYTGPGGDVVIPQGVATIGEHAFDKCETLTGITMPDSVTRIDRYAFDRCYNLTSISFSNRLTHVFDGAFNNCTGLTGVTLPDSLTSLGTSMFSGCSNLTSVTLPESITILGS